MPAGGGNQGRTLGFAGKRADKVMNKGNASLALSEQQYEEIETAVMESERGRTFLREFLKRNRHADTMMLLAAISRLESALCLKTVEHEEGGEFTPALADIASVVTATRTEIAAIRNDLITGGGAIPEGAEPFTAAAEEASRISADMLGQVEKLENLAWRLREDGAADAVCDQLDASIDELMALCWKQDVSGQRSAKAMTVLSFVNDRTGGNLVGTFDAEADHASRPDVKALPAAEEPPQDNSFFEADADLFGDDGGVPFEPAPIPVSKPAAPLMRVADTPVDEPAGSEAAAPEAIAPEAEAGAASTEPGEPGTAAEKTQANDDAPVEETEKAAAGAEDTERPEEEGNGHIVIIRTPSAPAPSCIPEPAPRSKATLEEPGESGETPLVSIPAQRPA